MSQFAFGPVTTSPYSAPSGSAAAPGYSFAADSTTGMYLKAAGDLGFACGGFAAADLTRGTLNIQGTGTSGTSTSAISLSDSANTQMANIGYLGSNDVFINNRNTGGAINLYTNNTGGFQIDAAQVLNNLQSNNESTGAGSALLGAANCPAVTPSAVFKWLKIKLSDGSTCYLACWK